MRHLYRNRGFSIIESVIIIVVVGIVGVLGVTFYNLATKKTASSNTTSATAESIKATPIPEVNATSDLDTVTSDLDKLDLTDTEDANLLNEQNAAF